MVDTAVRSVIGATPLGLNGSLEDKAEIRDLKKVAKAFCLDVVSDTQGSKISKTRVESTRLTFKLALF